MSHSSAAVVGGGLVGMLTGLRLRDRGFDVTLFEGSRLGSGASQAALGSITPWSDHSANVSVCDLAIQSCSRFPGLLEELIGRGGCAVDFEATGTLELAYSDAHSSKLLSTYSFIRDRNAKCEILDTQQAVSLEPLISPPLLALHYVDEAQIDVAQLIESVKSAIRHSGVLVKEGVQVLDVDDSGASAVTVTTNNDSQCFDVAVVCTGAGPVPLARFQIPSITRVRGEVLEVRSPPGSIRRSLYSGRGFIAPKRDGRLFLGSNYVEETTAADLNPATISVGAAYETLAIARRMVPALDEMQLIRSWKGWRPKTPDEQPIVGPLGSGRILLALGFLGLGITLAPTISELLARIAAGEAVDIPSCLSHTRFARESES